MKNGQKLAVLAGLVILGLAGGLSLVPAKVSATATMDTLVVQYADSVNEALAEAEDALTKTASMPEAANYREYLSKWVRIGEDFLVNPGKYDQAKTEEIIAALKEGAKATKLLTGVTRQEMANQGATTTKTVTKNTAKRNKLARMEAEITVVATPSEAESTNDSRSRSSAIRADIENTDNNSADSEVNEEEVEVPNTGMGVEDYQLVAWALAVVAVATGAIVNLLWGLEKKNA